MLINSKTRFDVLVNCHSSCIYICRRRVAIRIRIFHASWFRNEAKCIHILSICYVALMSIVNPYLNHKTLFVSFSISFLSRQSDTFVSFICILIFLSHSTSIEFWNIPTLIDILLNESLGRKNIVESPDTRQHWCHSRLYVSLVPGFTFTF